MSNSLEDLIHSSSRSERRERDIPLPSLGITETNKYQYFKKCYII